MDVEPERERIASSLWDLIRCWDAESLADHPLVAAGADTEELSKALMGAAYEAVFGTLYALDEEDTELDGLHEDLLTSDPTGREGADFLS